MIIRPKNYKASQISIMLIEHFIATILTFLISFVLLFYFGLRSNVKNNSKFLEYLFEHPSYYILICVSITFIANMVIVIKNGKKISIREFEFSENNSLITICYKKGYRNSDYKIELLADSINFATKNGESFLGDNTKILEIHSKGNEMLKLDVFDFIWSNDKSAIRRLFAKIKVIKK